MGFFGNWAFRGRLEARFRCGLQDEVASEDSRKGSA